MCPLSTVNASPQKPESPRHFQRPLGNKFRNTFNRHRYTKQYDNTNLELQIAMEKTLQKLTTIHLFCPSLSTFAPFLASRDHYIDIGSIAAIFGLDPSSLKLNGRFLSRGRDLISSVTWNSLLSFFSTKRLPIGSSHNDALLVDGKLSKIGAKRVHGSQEFVSGDRYEADEEHDDVNAGRIKPESNLVKNKKMKFMDFGTKHMDSPSSKFSPNGCKRKQQTEEVILLKKLKLNETKSGFDELSDGGVSDTANVAQRTAYSCSVNSNMKRMREEETLVSALCKRSR